MEPKWLPGSAAALEGVTGLALLLAPSAVARLLLGGDLTGVGPAVGRVAGIALLALGFACWPGPGAGRGSPAARGLLCYNLLVAIYLACLGLGSEGSGVLLWPTVVLHATLTLALVWSGLRKPRRLWPAAGSE